MVTKEIMKDYFEGISDTDVYTTEIEIEEKIHNAMPKYRGLVDMSKELVLKSKFNEIGMFCFVSWNWINPLAEWIGERKCLEVMAGRGWLTHGLRQKGVSITATDDFSWHKLNQYKKWNNLVTDVENLDAVESVEKYGRDIDILIMAWPFMDDTAYRVIKKLYEVNPNAVVLYCGEGYGGCTADESFFGSFDRTDDETFYDNVASKYTSWYGVYDRLIIGRYKKEFEE